MHQQEVVAPTENLSIADSIVFFCDLLGFSHQVRAAADLDASEALIKTLQRFAKEFTEDPATHGFFQRKYWIFSDSMVAVWGMRSDAVVHMTEFDAILSQLSGLAAAQAVMMISHGQPVRGGVARGWFREDDGTVVSSALVRAAELEKKVANPFIAVHPEVYDYFVGHKGRSMYVPEIDPVTDLFIPPSAYTGGIPALNYLRIGISEIYLSPYQMTEAKKMPAGKLRDDFTGELYRLNRRKFAEDHRDRVATGVSSVDAAVRVKFQSLRQYHNDFVADEFPGKEDLLV